jgi:hypothetical protein
MLNIHQLPVGTAYHSVSEEEWFAVGVDDDGAIESDRNFRPIADCATFAEAQQASLQGDIRGRVYIDEVTMAPNGSGGGSVFVGYQSELRAGLRIPVQGATSNTGRQQQVA